MCTRVGRRERYCFRIVRDRVFITAEYYDVQIMIVFHPRQRCCCSQVGKSISFNFDFYIGTTQLTIVSVLFFNYPMSLCRCPMVVQCFLCMIIHKWDCKSKKKKTRFFRFHSKLFVQSWIFNGDIYDYYGWRIFFS